MKKSESDKWKNQNYKFGDDIPLEWLEYKTESINKSRIKFISIVIFGMFIIIILRLWYFCININHGKKMVKSQQKFSGFYRPDILDRNNEVLVTSLVAYDLYAEPYNVIDAKKAAAELIKIFPKMNYQDVFAKLTSDKSFVYIARKITPLEKEKALLIGEPGLGFKKNERRVYPQSNLFAHIIGNSDTDNRGIAGIEKYIDDNNLTQSQKPVVLSVDGYIQDIVRKNLLNAMKEYGAKMAAGVIMDIKTGEILSMVSLPDFHNNDYPKIMNNPLYNNHVSLDVYEVGSVLKIFNTALALENNYPEDKLFDVVSGYMIGKKKVTDSHVFKKMLNITEGFVHSSNVVMANVARDLGAEKQQEFLRSLKLLKRLDFELPERGFPIFPQVWTDYFNASIGFGYGLNPTMLHIVAAVSAIVNDGMFVNPTILKRDENSVLRLYQVVSVETSAKIREWMRNVVTEGTGVMAKIKEIGIAGKTGTAIKLVSNEYTDSKKRTFFVSVFPNDNPKYTMLIMLDEAQNKWCDSASCTAVPVSANIIREIVPMIKTADLY